MRVETKYLGFIVSVFVVTFGLLGLLFGKYTNLTLGHFVALCQQAANSFFSSGVHFIGFGVLLLVFIVMAIFLAKTVFSLVKTRKKINQLLKLKKARLPKKLQPICDKHTLEQLTIVVGHKNHYALSFGLLSPKILLSTGLIKALSHKELESVVLHEQYHVKHRHPLLLLIGEVSAVTFFFLPFLADVVKKMRSGFEQAADDFVILWQQSPKHLHLALKKTTSAVSFQPYPSFSRRKTYVTSRQRLIVSAGSLLLALALLLLPTTSHAGSEAVLPDSLICEGFVCSAKCVSRLPFHSEISSVSFSSASYSD